MASREKESPGHRYGTGAIYNDPAHYICITFVSEGKLQFEWANFAGQGGLVGGEVLMMTARVCLGYE